MHTGRVTGGEKVETIPNFGATAQEAHRSKVGFGQRAFHFSVGGAELFAAQVGQHSQPRATALLFQFPEKGNLGLAKLLPPSHEDGDSLFALIRERRGNGVSVGGGVE